MRKVSYLSYNMTTADANNPDGIVPVGRQFDFIGDVETEEMILVDGEESLCLGYEDVKISTGICIHFSIRMDKIVQIIKEIRIIHPAFQVFFFIILSTP